MWEDFEVKLAGGEYLGGRWIGDPSKSRIVLYFHGFPGCRIEAMLGHLAATERKVSLLAFDRPGLGRSRTPVVTTVCDVTVRIIEALDVLQIQKVDIIAVSGGTPYGVSVASALKDRVGKCAFVSPLWDTGKKEHLQAMNFANRSLIRLGRSLPWLGRTVLTLMAWSWRSFPKLATAWFGFVLPPVDRKILKRKSVLPIMNHNLAEALVQGARGIVSEYSRFTEPRWQVDASEVSMPVRIWHGTQDDYVPLIMARSLAAQIPGASFILVEGGGHFMMVDLLSDVLDWCIEGD